MRVALLLFIILTCYACNNTIIYHEVKTLPSPWKYNDTVQFDYVVEDTTNAYDLSVDVYHADSFAFENVYVMVTTVFPEGKTTKTPLSLQLASTEGKWQGDCSGNDCYLTIQMSSGAYFKQPGNYRLIFEQYSRQNELPGIERLGLTIQKASN